MEISSTVGHDYATPLNRGVREVHFSALGLVSLSQESISALLGLSEHGWVF